MHLNHSIFQKEDSDDENFALSENWTFQPHIRRWSRIGEAGMEIPLAIAKLSSEKPEESSSKESSPERFEDNNNNQVLSTDPNFNASADSNQADSANSNSTLRRSGSERIKDGAKAFLRRVESIKSRRRKRHCVVINTPQGTEVPASPTIKTFPLSSVALEPFLSLRKPIAVYSTPPSPSAASSPMHGGFQQTPTYFRTDQKGLPPPTISVVPPCNTSNDNFLSPHRASAKKTVHSPRTLRTSPLHLYINTMPHVRESSLGAPIALKSDDSSSYYSDSQESSSTAGTNQKCTLRRISSKGRRFLQRSGKVDDIGAHSDSECHQGRKLIIKDSNRNNNNSTNVKNSELKVKKLARGGSLNLGREGGKRKEGNRTSSFRSRSINRREAKADENDTLKK